MLIPSGLCILKLFHGDSYVSDAKGNVDTTATIIIQLFILPQKDELTRAPSQGANARPLQPT